MKYLNITSLFVILSLVLGLLLLNESQSKVHNPVTIQRILEKHTDTLRVLDTVLKYKIKTIESDPDTIIIQKVDSIYGRTDTVFLGRELLKCSDSLSTCKQKLQIDSSALSKIDSLMLDTKKPTREISDRLKDVGVGVLIGIGVKSFF